MKKRIKLEKYSIKGKEPSFDYDETADVMYITFGEPKPCRTEEPESGLVIQYTPETGELNGFTIIDYSKRVNKEKNDCKTNKKKIRRL
jgi:uncharacterized protein YuzE